MVDVQEINSLSLYDEDKLIGVAICGRPIARKLDDGNTLEINRVCVLEGYQNACSMLYGRCTKIAKLMGYAKVITYTMESENGASLKASNFRNMGKAGKTAWTSERYNPNTKMPNELKNRWEIKF